MGNLGPGMSRSSSKGAKPCRFADHPTAPVISVHRLVAIARNWWSRSIVTAGRNQSEWPVAIARCAHWGLEDTRLLGRLLNLPDLMWRRARRKAPRSPYWFVDLQTALALDILLHSPLRIEDLQSLKFDEHIYWAQGKGRPALITIRQAKVEDNDPLECELPSYLSDRLYAFRNEIAADVIGRRPEFLFISADGVRRTIATLRVAIQRAVLRNVGIKITPHQFRHLAGKLHLDAYPNAHELVRQFLGHSDIKTTTRFYAGPNTRRAGKAHADLIRKLREPSPKRRKRNNDSGEGRI